MKKKSQS